MRLVLLKPLFMIFLFLLLPAILLSEPLGAPTIVVVAVTPPQPVLFRVLHVAQGVGPLTVKVTTALTTALNIPVVAFLHATRFFAVASYSSNLRNSASVITVTPASTAPTSTAANNSTSILLSALDVFQAGRQYTQLFLGYGYEGSTSLRSLLFSERSSLPATTGYTYIRWVHAAVGLATPRSQPQSPLPLEAALKYVRLMTPGGSTSTISKNNNAVAVEEAATETSDIRTAKKPAGPTPEERYTLNFEHLYPPSGSDPLSVASGLYEISLRNKGGPSLAALGVLSPAVLDSDGSVIFKSHFRFQPLKSYLLTILLAGNSTTIAAGKNIQVLVVDEVGGTTTMMNEIA